ncbi:MAG TPA: glycosyl hydrolase [Edaphobacter sp.]|nr:glycosyl hydrolase [Edaphobacter sp.]
MKDSQKRFRNYGISGLLWVTALFHPYAQSQTLASVEQSFHAPPDDARVMMRWWWFGPAVTHQELEREILAMKAGGLGGFEIQPVYPLSPDDSSKHIRNIPYLSDDFLDAVRFTSQKAHENGMRVDITLGSGWPFGGPQVPVDEASARLRIVAIDIPADSSSLPLPSIEEGEAKIAAFIGNGTAKKYDPANLQQIEVHPLNGRMTVDAKPEPRVIVFYISSRTGQQVKRAAVNAEGFVIDHFSRTAVANYLHNTGDRWMQAFGDTPPYAVFSDSLEVFGADWTPDLLEEFQRRRGYDLTPYLPELTNGTDEKSAEIKHDWGLTLTELVNERFLSPINDWAKEHHTLLRAQNYGFPDASLSSNRLVSLPEGEGPQWQRFSFSRWASSASHLYGNPVTSAETWTWLHSPVFRATPLDMKAEADRFFLEGINQLIGHGWPYSPQGVEEPGWRFYAAAVFDDHNPWWPVMPDVARYLQRVSYLLRQGKPANDIAVLLPNDDVYADLKLGRVSLSDGMPKHVTPELTRQILDAGYNMDYIDAEAIQRLGISYPVLVLPHVKRLAPQTLQALIAYVQHGGKIVAVGSTPDASPGFEHAQEIASQVKSLSHDLFSNAGQTQVVANDTDLGGALEKALKPDVKLQGTSGDVGVLHRRLENADVYFIANTSNREVNATAEFRAPRKVASWWDPFTGTVHRAGQVPSSLKLAPYESRVLVLSDTPIPAAQPPQAEPSKVLADITQNWEVRFPGLKDQTSAKHWNQLGSWTDDPATRFYSGEVVYTKTISLKSSDLAKAQAITIDFGEGTPVPPDPKAQHCTAALLEGPIREAAIVLVNGKQAGALWHPPYALDITPALRAGQNSIEIRVLNTAINQLSGQTLPDYRLLNARYGERFVPQDVENLKPLPSGILGKVRLLTSK